MTKNATTNLTDNDSQINDLNQQRILNFSTQNHHENDNKLNRINSIIDHHHNHHYHQSIDTKRTIKLYRSSLSTMNQQQQQQSSSSSKLNSNVILPNNQTTTTMRNFSETKGIYPDSFVVIFKELFSGKKRYSHYHLVSRKISFHSIQISFVK